MFGHNTSSSSDRGNAAMPDGTLTNEDTAQAAAALIGDMTSKYPPTDLPTPTTAPAPAPDIISADNASTSTFGADVPAPSTPSSTTPASPAASDDLLGIKQQALQQLSPLVDHLDQSAADKFRTTMMMIQASDNPAFIKTAYEAALQISDDKERAHALLDLVNEINYFTQKGQGTTSSGA